MAGHVFKFRHGWIPVGGGGDKGKARSADKLAAGVTGRERVPGPQGYTGRDVARLGSGPKIGDGSGARLGTGPKIGDGSGPDITHTTHSVAGPPVSADDALLAHPGTAKDLGADTMSPQAFDAAVRAQLAGAKAGEHISVEQAKGRTRFVKAMTVAALASSLAGFAGAPGLGGDENAPPDVGLYSREDHSDFRNTLGRGGGFTFGELPAVDYGTGQRKKTIIH